MISIYVFLRAAVNRLDRLHGIAMFIEGAPLLAISPMSVGYYIHA
jgi:hypothetical protein